MYAQDTSVPVEKSKAEIEKTLMRYGASEFASGWDRDRAIIMFRCKDRAIRFVLPLPVKDDRRFAMTPGGRRRRDEQQQYAAWEQACRQRWRALCLCIKAKLEAVAAGITSFEDEFLAHIVLPDGSTAGLWLRPQIEQAYKSGKMPTSILALPPGADDV